MRSTKHFFLLLVVPLLLSAQQRTPEAPKKVISFDVTAMDKSVDPCVDFYQYACGNWRKDNPVPPDQTRWARFTELFQNNQLILRDILEKTAAGGSKRSEIEQKTGDDYAACMDEAGIERAGIKSLKPLLGRINKLKSAADLDALTADLHNGGINAL